MPGGPHLVHEGGRRACPRCAPWSSTDLNSNSIYSHLWRKKSQRARFIMFYDTEPPPSPKLSREG